MQSLKIVELLSRYFHKDTVIEDFETTFPDVRVVQHPEFQNLYLFDYKSIVADFSCEVVRESRGLVLDRDNGWQPVCRSFIKFFNAEESLAAKIDWPSAKVYEKLDGSLLNLWFYNGKWHVSTNGSPNAGGKVGSNDFTFQTLFWEVFDQLGYKTPTVFSKEFEKMTFMFELMTPYNQIVVRHPQNRLTLIACRWNDSGKEVDPAAFKNCYDYVRLQPFGNMDDIKAYLETTSPFEQEGFVVVDKDWQRIKIKSARYVEMHHLRSSFTPKKCLQLILKNEQSEFLSYFPEFKEELANVETKFITCKQQHLDFYQQIKHIPVQKDFALEAKKMPCSGALFALRANKVSTFNEFVLNMTENNALELISKY